MIDLQSGDFPPAYLKGQIDRLLGVFSGNPPYPYEDEKTPAWVQGWFDADKTLAENNRDTRL